MLRLCFVATLIVLHIFELSGQVIPNLSGEMYGTLKKGRSDFFAAAIDDSTILVVGGFVGTYGFPKGAATRTCEYINTRQGTISPAPSMNFDRAIFASVVLPDSSIVVFGGITSDGGVTETVEMFDNASREWIRLPDMSIKRWQHTVSILSDSLVVIVGGRKDYDNSTTSVEVLNLNSKTISPVADYPVALHNQVSLQVENNTVLVFGGREGGTNSSRPSKVYAYSYPNPTWQSIANLPQGGFTLSETARLEDGRYLVAGGALAESPLLNSKLAFLWQDDRLSALLSVSLPGRVYHELEVWDNRYVFVAGGLEDGGSTSDNMSAFDLTSGEEVVAIQLFEERSRHELVQMTDENGSAEYFVISGLNAGNRISSTIERYFVDYCLVGDWSFDAQSKSNGMYLDQSGYDNHAFIEGSPDVVDGALREAVKFDGVDDFLYVPDNPSLQLPSFTVSLFVQFPQEILGVSSPAFEEPETYAIFNKGGWGTEVPDSNNNYSISMDSDRLYLGYESRRNDDNNEGVLMPVPRNSSAWYHYAMTFDSRYLAVYQNGILVERIHSPYLPDICNMDLVFGRNGLANYLTTRFFSGAIDEVKLFSCALSEQQIVELYNEREPIVSVDDADRRRTSVAATGLVVEHEYSLPQGAVRATVVDQRGSYVLARSVEGIRGLPVSTLAAGVYFVLVDLATGERLAQKISIVR